MYKLHTGAAPAASVLPRDKQALVYGYGSDAEPLFMSGCTSVGDSNTINDEITTFAQNGHVALTLNDGPDAQYGAEAGTKYPRLRKWFYSSLQELSSPF